MARMVLCDELFSFWFFFLVGGTKKKKNIISIDLWFAKYAILFSTFLKYYKRSFKTLWLKHRKQKGDCWHSPLLRLLSTTTPLKPGGILPREYLVHLLLQALLDLELVPGQQFFLAPAEQIFVDIKILEHHLGVKDVLLVNIDVHHLVILHQFLGEVVLDGVDLVVDVVFLAGDVPGKSPHPVIHDGDVGIKTVDQVVQGSQRRDHPAGGDVDVGPKSADPVVGVAFGIGVDGDVALV